PPERNPFVGLRDPRRSRQACAGICGLPVDHYPSFHAPQGCRGISDLGLPRTCGRPIRIGDRHRYLVIAPATRAFLSAEKSGRAADNAAMTEFDPKPNSQLLFAATHQAR